MGILDSIRPVRLPLAAGTLSAAQTPRPNPPDKAPGLTQPGLSRPSIDPHDRQTLASVSKLISQRQYRGGRCLIAHDGTALGIAQQDRMRHRS